jgi:L-threonylcarbamoyladenylate synthase
MALEQRDVLFALRQGHLIEIADETGLMLACDPQHPDGLRQLLAARLTLTPVPMPTVLVAGAGNLSLYARPVPEVAYDLVDFATRAVVVILRGSVGLPEPMQHEIPIRKSLNDTIQHLLGGFGRGLLTLPFETDTWPVGLPRPELRWGKLPETPIKPRILRIGQNGELDFIRK